MEHKKLVEALLSECKDCSERGRSDNACHSLFYCANRDAADLIEELAARLAESERQRAAAQEHVCQQCRELNVQCDCTEWEYGPQEAGEGGG